MGFSPEMAGQMALISQAGGAINSAIGTYYSGKTQASNLGIQAANLQTQAVMADINARTAELGAQSVLNQAKQQKAALTLGAKQLKGRQRASLAANGVDLSEGNAAEIQESTDLMKDIDAGALKANALRTAWGYRAEGLNQQNQAAMARVSANAAQATAGTISPFTNAATTLLGGAGSVAASWYALKKEGAL